MPWFGDPHCLAVKFEDLYPEVLDLRNNVLGDAMKKILSYLEIEPQSIDPVDMFDKVYGKSITATPEEQKVGQYKRYFKDHHYAQIDNPESRSGLRELGYEW